MKCRGVSVAGSKGGEAGPVDMLEHEGMALVVSSGREQASEEANIVFDAVVVEPNDRIVQKVLKPRLFLQGIGYSLVASEHRDGAPNTGTDRS